MLISKSEYSVTEVALSKYETAHGFTFPQEYRAFLLKYNGGETPETDFRLSGVSSDLVSFYELRDDGDGLELHEIEFLVPAFLKDHMLPIASNVFGDNIFICVEGRENGEMFSVTMTGQSDISNLRMTSVLLFRNAKAKSWGAAIRLKIGLR